MTDQIAIDREKLRGVARFLENSMFTYIGTGEKAQELASDLYRLLTPTPAPRAVP